MIVLHIETLYSKLVLSGWINYLRQYKVILVRHRDTCVLEVEANLLVENCQSWQKTNHGLSHCGL